MRRRRRCLPWRHDWYWDVVKTDEQFLWDTVDVHVRRCRKCDVGAGRGPHDMATDNAFAAKRRYEAEREANTTPVTLTITTRVPSKWLAIDRETGDRWEQQDGRWVRAEEES